MIAEIFRACPCGSKQGARLLCVLLEQGVITQELINMLMCWNHHSGFNVHVRGEIAGTDGDAIENIARYMSRAAISVDRVEFNPEDNTLTVYEKKDRPSSGMQATYTIMEFMALLAAHIPSPYESLVYYYGIYSSSPSTIPSMPIKKSPKVLPDQCAQKQRDHPLCRREPREGGSK